MSMQTNAWRAALAAMVAAGVSMAGAARAETVLTFADSFPDGHYLAEEGMKYWMQRAEELSDGAISWTYFPAGQIAKAGGILTAVRDGRVDAGYVGIGYFSDKLPLNSVSMLPGMAPTAGAGSPGYWAMLKADGPLRQEFLDSNAVPMMGVMLDPYQMVMATPPLTTPEDFVGKKVRSGGGAMNLTLESLGATPVAMPAPDMYVAMERGTVDGTLFAINSVKPYRVDELTESVSTNGPFGTFVITIAINKETFEGLAPAEQEALRQAGEETVTHLANYVDANVGKRLEEFRAQGITVYDFPPDVVTVLEEALTEAEADWVRRMSDRGLPAAEVLADFKRRMQP
ncbi:TRAP transporter substrate-binding protein DctP [Roseospira goensis]|uniref:TRAP-type C4-dicarboxylate transport system substrate-binding protein n=1 Tax=Roseospira goensis TaxID=391922 RepID=A0A7W6WKL8_9PROT|nr:TRAP transporter substrate-binding protein DctP [Roseospira goensis]MBB4285899.1 TRAP-type C4-dicarboxylate transport system substrate-binding protein [Roseospira goensis]